MNSSAKRFLIKQAICLFNVFSGLCIWSARLYLSFSILLRSLASSDARTAHAPSCDCSIIIDLSNI